MLILVEGPDNTGKTTLAEALANRLGWTYYHHGPPEGGASGYLDQLLNLKQPTVMDRSFIGELVYGPMLRSYSCIDDFQFAVLCRVAARLGALVVMSDIPEHVHQKWHKDDPALGITWEKNCAARKAFRNVGCKVSNYLPLWMNQHDTKAGLDGLVKALMGRANQYKDRHDVIQPKLGIGSLYPKLILIGDQVNTRLTWRGLPFDRGTSSKYLMDSLAATVIPGHHIYFINALDEDGNETDPGELKRLDGQGVELGALGTKAEAWCRKHFNNYTRLDHPAYRRRFKFDKMHEYSQQLQDIYLYACA